MTLYAERTFTSEPFTTPDGEVFVIKLRYDDSCGNGHNTFSITVDGWYSMRRFKANRDIDFGGCTHELIAKHAPQFAPLTKWHLVSDDGPLHYIASTVYWAKEGNLEAARANAVDYLGHLTLEGLKSKSLLEARLPWLMERFNHDMESIKHMWQTERKKDCSSKLENC